MRRRKPFVIRPESRTAATQPVRWRSHARRPESQKSKGGERDCVYDPAPGIRHVGSNWATTRPQPSLTVRSTPSLTQGELSCSIISTLHPLINEMRLSDFGI